VMGLWSIFGVVKKFRLGFVMPTVNDIKKELRDGWQITATNLSNNICQYSNIFILRFFTNDLVTGYYSIAERIFLTLRQMLGVYSQAVYPQVCLIIGKSREAILSYFKKNYLPFLAVLGGGCIILFVFAPAILYFFIGHDNEHSAFLLRIFSGVLLIACLNVPPTLILLAADERGKYFKVYTTGVVLNVLLNILLAFYWQATGTAIAIFITELFILIGLTREGMKLAIFSSPVIRKHAKTIETE
jgi:PST family polysaccharide transporter